MALEIAVNVPQGRQVVHREEAPVGQGGVQPRSGVALGEDEAVPILLPGVLGINVHLLEKEIGEYVGGGQAAAGVAGLGAVGSLDDAYAHLAGRGHQLLFLTGCHISSPLYKNKIGSADLHYKPPRLKIQGRKRAERVK